MTRRSLLRSAATLATGHFLSGWATAADESESALIARRRTLEASRRLAADGWKVRDGLLTTPLQPGQPALVPVHLIAGVQYLFAAVARPSDHAFTIDLLDATGHPLQSGLPVEDMRVDAVLHTAEKTARCHLRLAVKPGALPADVAVLYVYR